MYSCCIKWKKEQILLDVESFGYFISADTKSQQIVYELEWATLPGEIQKSRPFKGQVHTNITLIVINRVKLNKHNAENFIKIGCKIRKLWHFKVSPISTKQLYAQHRGYANEIADDIMHSLFLLYCIIWIID